MKTILIILLTIGTAQAQTIEKGKVDSIIMYSPDSAKIYKHWIDKRKDWRYTPIINKTKKGMYVFAGWVVLAVALYDKKCDCYN